ncbi:MAG: hypothetical protein M0P31_14720 [Solirubrobacteraceae bacterium]|nr:hypothetical protein [Solirubrobacteraceae bacterium]
MPVADIERLLRDALSPVDPPERLGTRVEQTLRSLSELAADELESWELAAMRDPRNWIRPAVAVGVSGAAGAGLAVIGWRQRRRQRDRRSAGAGADGLDRAVADLADALRRRLQRPHER